MIKVYKEFAEAVNRFESFTILMHDAPDGDSVASMFSLKRILESKNKKVELAIHSPITENFECWLDRHKYINKIVMPKKKTECLIIVDTPNKDKTYSNFKDLADYVIVIDHHKNSTRFGDMNISKAAASTGVIIYEMLDYLDAKLDRTLAEYLFISLCWDTEGFKNSYATPYVYEIAAKLLSEGAVQQRVFRYLFEYRKYNELEVQKLMFNSIRTEGKVNYISLDRKIMTKIDNHDIYNFLNYVKLIESVEIFIIFIERSGHIEIKMNNNQKVYSYLKSKYGKLYNVKINESFYEDVEQIVSEVKPIL